MKTLLDNPTDILSLYSDANLLIKDCKHIKSLLNTFPILDSSKNFTIFFDECFKECSYVLPEDCHINHFKQKYSDLYFIMYESCLLTTLSTIENLLHANEIILATHAYKHFPYKRSNSMIDQKLCTTNTKITEHEVFEPVRKLTGNEKNAREAFEAIQEEDGGLDSTEFASASYTCITRYKNCQESYASLLSTFELSNTQSGKNENDIYRYLYLTNLPWQINLLRHGEYNKYGYPNLTKQANNLKKCVNDYHLLYNGEEIAEYPSDITDSISEFLKGFISTHSNLMEEYIFYNCDSSFPYQNIDTLMSYQKTNLILAPDIARLINSNLGKDSFLDRKGLLSYMLEKITIPFSRDVIINTFLSPKVIINLDSFDIFFDVFYPLLVRVYLFSLLKFPETPITLFDSLEAVKKDLLEHTLSNIYLPEEGYPFRTDFHHLYNYVKCQQKNNTIPKKDLIEVPLYDFAKDTTYSLKKCTKQNTRSNAHVYGFIHPNHPIIRQDKQTPGLPGKENKYPLIRLAKFISEAYGVFPIINKHYFPVSVDADTLENFSILVGTDICGTDGSALRKQYLYLSRLNIDNALKLFQTEDWTHYKEKHICTHKQMTVINTSIISKYRLPTDSITLNDLNIYQLQPNERKEIAAYLSNLNICSMLLDEINRAYKITRSDNATIRFITPTHLQDPL